MAEWLYEDGIGEARAALVVDGRIVAAAIERAGGARLGTVAGARLVEILPGRHGRATLDDGTETLVAHVPAKLTQGAACRLAIVREAIPEPGRPKPARATVTDAPLVSGPDLRQRIAADGPPVRECLAHEPDRIEAAGWSELIEEARTGEIAFAGGALRLSPTPAMALFDVDGLPPVEPLTIAAAHAVAATIRRLAIGGSIGIDFPTLAGKAARRAVATAIDESLPAPFERTTLNGFGFLQIVRPRPSASVAEIVRADPAETAALALLRTLERTPPGAPLAHRVPTAVHKALAAHPDWLATLARRTGVTHVIDSL